MPGESETVAVADTGSVLVDLGDGYAALFSEGDNGDLLSDIGWLPERDAVFRTLAAVGEVAGAVGNLTKFQGLYQIDSATKALLDSGARLAAKDGASLGGVFLTGEIVRQARFTKVTLNAGQVVGAIGPALGAMALQATLAEISKLARTNIELTTQVLGSFRRAQWAELNAVVEEVSERLSEAREIQGVPDTLWDQMSHLGSKLTQQEKLVQGEVDNHTRQIEQRSGAKLAEYLQQNMEDIAFNTHAVLKVTWARATYDSLRAARARRRGQDDSQEAQLAERLLTEASARLEERLASARSLLGQLTRRLGLIVGESQGGWPLVPDAKREAREGAERLLNAVLPLAERVGAVPAEPDVPTIVGVSDGEAREFLGWVRWHMEVDEEVVSLAAMREAPAAKPSPKEEKASLFGSWGKIAVKVAAFLRLPRDLLVAVTDQGALIVERGKVGRADEAPKRIDRTAAWRVRVPDVAGNPVVRFTHEKKTEEWRLTGEADRETAQELATALKTGRAEPGVAITSGNVDNPCSASQSAADGTVTDRA